MKPPAIAAKGQPLTFSGLYYWMCAAVLWSYFVTIFVYKVWYFIVAAVCVLTLLLVVNGTLKTKGLVRHSLPVALFYGYATLTSLWAMRPDESLWWGWTTAIQLVVFLLFYLLALNCSLRQVSGFMVAVMLPSFVCMVILWWIEPNSERLGGRAPSLVATLLPFSLIRLKFSSRLEGLVPFILGMGVLVLSMSRTPLMAGVFGVALAVVIVSDSLGQFLKLAGGFAVAAAISLGLLLSFETTRIFVAKTAVRALNEPMVVGDVVIQPEGEDWVRRALDEEVEQLIDTALPWGIGYMNFMHYFQQRYRFEMSLHNVYKAVPVELGLPGLAIAAWMFFNFFSAVWKCRARAQSREERAIYLGFAAAMACVMAIGIYHQSHQMPGFYVLAGCVAALAERKAAELRVSGSGLRVGPGKAQLAARNSPLETSRAA